MKPQHRCFYQIFSAQTSLCVYSTARRQPHSRSQLDDDDLYTPRVYFAVRTILGGPTPHVSRCRPMRFVLADFLAYVENPETEIGRLDYLSRTDLLYLTAGDLH